MRLLFIKLVVLAMAAIVAIDAGSADSTDALIVLTTVGYLTGAADACRVARKESNQLRSGLAIAIGHGNYGTSAHAHALFNNARQEGVEAANAGKVNCEKVADAVHQYVRSLLSK